MRRIALAAVAAVVSVGVAGCGGDEPAYEVEYVERTEMPTGLPSYDPEVTSESFLAEMGEDMAVGAWAYDSEAEAVETYFTTHASAEGPVCEYVTTTDLSTGNEVFVEAMTNMAPADPRVSSSDLWYAIVDHCGA
jgi:hypothetical protein